MKGSMIATIIVAAVVVVGVGVWILVGSQNSTPVSAPATSGGTMIPSSDGSGSIMEGTSTIPSMGTSVKPVDTPIGSSDAAINQDLGTFDTQMNGLNSDTNSIDQGLNDQTVPQEQL